jgi:hypothetical protein
VLNIFENDAFSSATLTDVVAEMRIHPGRLQQLGLFETTSVTTLTIALERIGDTIQLVAPSPRGGLGEIRDYPKRSIENLSIPHFQRDWSVMADEVQGVREIGSETALKTVQSVVSERIKVNLADLDLTEEHARLGAIQGIVTYKGGQTLNLFSKFGMAEPAEINFDLTNSSPVDGILRKKCADIIRVVRKELGAVPFDYVHAMVGDDFFDDLLIHPEVRESYKGQSEAAFLRNSYVGKNRSSNPIFEFGGIVFENYGAIDETGDGALMGIHTDKAKFLPVGTRGLFRTYYAPADYMDTVNTPGKPRYVHTQLMPNDKGMSGETQMNALSICTRPNTLLRAKRA